MYIIRPLGCHFHYAKCIWKQVVNAGLKTQYSKTKDDALSELIVAAIGMAYVPIEELKNAMKILKKLASKLPTGKQKNFGKDFLKYYQDTWISGHFSPESWNYWGHKGATTNNYNEGYNSRFNNCLNLHPNPNPYNLAKVIKEELLNAQNDENAATMGNPNIKSAASKSGKRKELLERKQNLMKEYDRSKDLEKFIKALGHNCMIHDQRIAHTIHDLTFDNSEKKSYSDSIDLDHTESESIFDQSPEKSVLGDELREKRRKNPGLSFSDKSLRSELTIIYFI